MNVYVDSNSEEDQNKIDVQSTPESKYRFSDGVEVPRRKEKFKRKVAL